MDDVRRVPWSWPEIVAAALVWLAAPGLVYHAFNSLGVFAAHYGPERAASPSPLDQSRFLLWVGVAAFPFQLATLLALIVNIGGRASDFGLSWARLGPQILAALDLAVNLVPAVYLVNALTLAIADRLGVPQQPHSFTKLLQSGLSPAELMMLGVSAVVVAPVCEEICFRGLLQPVVVLEGWVGEIVALLMALLVAGLAGRGPFFAAVVAAAVTVVIPKTERGLYAVAVLFAFVHSATWPSPIPLLGLAVGLGGLARQGLVGPIVLHAVFNAAALLLWWALPGGEQAR